MRILTMITGALFIGGGVFLVANGGLTFMSLAFPIGVLFIVAGIVECLSYNSYRGYGEEKSWILIDGTTTFLLGALIILDKLTADAVVPMVLGLWVITTGVRNFVRAWENIEDRKQNFYDHLLIGLLNLVSGLYVFFDGDILNLTTLMIVGLCVIVQGINIFHVGATIIVLKPEFLKSKEEKLEEAAAKAEELRLAAKEAIKEAKAAHAEVKIIEEMPEGLVDITQAPKPGTPEAEELADAAAVFHGTAGPIVLAAMEESAAQAEETGSEK